MSEEKELSYTRPKKREGYIFRVAENLASIYILRPIVILPSDTPVETLIARYHRGCCLWHGTDSLARSPEMVAEEWRLRECCTCVFDVCIFFLPGFGFFGLGFQKSLFRVVAFFFIFFYWLVILFIYLFFLLYVNVLRLK